MANHLRLANTLTRSVEPFAPADPQRVSFYTCGPTVYDDAHIGNFRSFLAADLLRRWIESPLCTLATHSQESNPELHHGPRTVVHVMNITDVGHMTDDDTPDGGGADKMEAAAQRLAAAQQQAKKSGTAHAAADIDPTDPRQIAHFYTDRFLQDARALGLKVAIDAQHDASLMPRATDHILGMIRLIQRLEERGMAYVTGQAGQRAVYFRVQKFPDYGQLSGNTLDQLRGGAGGRVDEQNQAAKHHPADFLLWKEDATHIMKWPSPWGEGYPGWHIECSAMALERLVEGGLVEAITPDSAHNQIDLHSGGEDNIFPHHECEIAQTRGCTGAQHYARHWFHPRFLMVEGEKMSKSKGNFHTARDLFAKGHSPAAIRLELIKTHYRANANFTEQGLKDSARMIERWRELWDLAQPTIEPGDDPGEFVDAFVRALNDDLNIAGAIGAVNELRTACTSGSLRPGRRLVDALHAIDDVLGVIRLGRADDVTTEIGVFKGVDADPQVEKLLAERRDARAGKDFARADAIRAELSERGLAIKDIAGGKVEVSRA